MIKSFQHKGLKRLFEKGDRRGVLAQLADKITRRLDAIDAAAQVTDLNLPGFNLHELKGNRKGTWSITVSGNWRITFEFRDGDAYIVDFEDYH
jgi:toxin HigB-1